MRITRRLSANAVRWDRVSAFVETSGNYSRDDADTLVHSFRQRAQSFFHIEWVRSPQLSLADNAVAAGLCRAQGADVVELELLREARLFTIPLRYQHLVNLQPALRRKPEPEETGAVKYIVQLTFGPLSISMHSLIALGLVRLMLLCTAILTFTAGAGLLLYGVAVFAVFLQSPLATTVAATRQLPIGLGLLSAFTGVVAIGVLIGKAIRRLLVRRQISFVTKTFAALSRTPQAKGSPGRQPFSGGEKTFPTDH